MKSTRTNRILSVVLSLSIVIGITAISQETVLADGITSSGLMYSITNGAATVTGFYPPQGFSGTLVIPDTLGGASVKSIGDEAFGDGDGLIGITIPGSVTDIGDLAFEYCTSLKSITVASANTVYKSVDGVLYSKDGSLIIRCPERVIGSITILSGVKSIGVKAFYEYTSLTGISIPGSVTRIETNAFYGCTSLTEITIPSGVTSIAPFAFYQCASLTSVTIPDSVKSIGEYSFCGCSSLSEITIPRNVTRIWDYAFGLCTSLKSFTVAIENTAYKSVSGVLYSKDGKRLINCPQGKSGSVTIPGGVTSIGDYAFEYCINLTGITIPGSATSIGNYTFSNCTSLTGITIPNSIKSIGEGAFYWCESLTGITILGGVTSIGNSTFEYCSRLTGITIPGSVTSIGDAAFFGCEKLTAITIPSGVTNIGYAIFYGCTSLTAINFAAANTTYKSVNGIVYSKDGSTLILCPEGKSGNIKIPSGTTSIGDGAFGSCTSLTGITIPESVANIGAGAFYECTSLPGITIPGSVTSIGEGSFFYCLDLAYVTIKGDVTSIGSGAFDTLSNTLNFVVLTGKVPYYQALLNEEVMGFTAAVITDKYTVHFSTNGGIAGAGSDYAQYIGIDGLALAPANPPTRTGYDFQGWYTDEAGSNTWDFPAGIVTKNMTLYAKWTVVFGTPKGLKAVPASYNSNILTWTAVAASGYTIYRSTSPTSGFVSIADSATASYTDTGLATGKTYYYKIKAYTLAGDTKTYSAATAAASARPVLAMPTNLKAVPAGDNSNKLTWKAAAGVSGYVIYRSSSSASGFIIIAESASSSYTNTGLPTGKMYYYKIKAYKTVGTTRIYSDATAPVSAKR